MVRLAVTALVSLAATALGLPLADPKAPGLTYLYTANLTFPAPISIGTTPLGVRQILTISGGSFEGPKLSGTCVPALPSLRVVYVGRT